MGFGSNGNGSASISTASDAALNNPINNDILTYDSGTSKWKNAVGSSAVTVSTQTSSYTLTLSDSGKAVELTSGGATTVTVPPNSSVAFAVGTIIEVTRLGAGAVTIAAGAGVTLQSADSQLGLRAQYSVASLRKRATNTWLVAGDLS